jgi:prepilin-type N-terminal cleavage/methylation domain-containing protein
MSKIKFTLVELLVVITILAILMAMLMPALVRAKYTAKTTLCVAQLKQFGTGASLYGSDKNGKIPPRENTGTGAIVQIGYPHEMIRGGFNLFTTYIRPYISSDFKIMYCTSIRSGSSTNTFQWGSYSYYVWPNGFYWQVPQPNFTRYSIVSKPDLAPLWGCKLQDRYGVEVPNHTLSGRNEGLNAVMVDGSSKWFVKSKLERHWQYNNDWHYWPIYRN